jgi:protein TonB
MTTLAAFPRQPMSPLRIAGLSTALALHAAAFLVIVMPQTMALAALEEKPADIVVEWITAEIPPPPIPVPPVPPPPVRPKIREVKPEVVSVVLAESDYRIAATTPDPVRESIGPTIPDPGPTAVTAAALAYADVPPPPYPPMARKKNWQGEVLLRVRVDETGKPVAVEVEKSSGHRILDRAARDHVLKRWRFQPALVQGRPVSAWARVPLNFRIEAG